jgi:hypothetical protein
VRERRFIAGFPFGALAIFAASRFSSWALDDRPVLHPQWRPALWAVLVYSLDQSFVGKALISRAVHKAVKTAVRRIALRHPSTQRNVLTANFWKEPNGKGEKRNGFA